MQVRESWFASHVKELALEECLELLESGQVGRIGFTDPTGPVVLPVNYVVAGGCVLVLTSTNGSLARHAVTAPVAIEVDAVDEFTETGWSVLVRGHASVVEQQERLELHRNGDLPRPWVEGDRTLLLKISPTRVTGRRLIPA
jgi:nitroimidazol reductase NimA-like FMN-containing flavoprotein (pyridoxamine 5'-phosphate oxidase superfamily)